MLGRLYEAEDCSAARALELVGERWTLLILRDALFRHHTRFSQFQAGLAIAPNILTRRLAALTEAGIFRVPPGTREYVLTEMGQSLKPVVVALTHWGDQWISAGPARFVHTACEGEIEQRFWCDRCAQEVEPGEAQARRRTDDERQALDTQRSTAQL